MILIKFKNENKLNNELQKQVKLTKTIVKRLVSYCTLRRKLNCKTNILTDREQQVRCYNNKIKWIKVLLC